MNAFRRRCVPSAPIALPQREQTVAVSQAHVRLSLCRLVFCGRAYSGSEPQRPSTALPCGIGPTNRRVALGESLCQLPNAVTALYSSPSGDSEES